MKKRAFDIIFSAAGILALSPLLALIAIVIKATSQGPVIFRHERMGRDFKPFGLFKFRSMYDARGPAGPSITVGGDARITPVGAFLRKTKLDELPQLFNVLLGHMSLVGPRPEVREYVEEYRDEYAKILKVKPGMTDLASLSFRNEEEMLRGKADPEDFYRSHILPEKLKLSKEYVQKASLRYDLQLILLTMLKVAYPENLVERLVGTLALYRRMIIISSELGVFALANFLSFFIRFDGQIPGSELLLFAGFLPLVLLVRVTFLFIFSTYKGLWRYASTLDMLRIATSVTAGSLFIFIGIRYVFGEIAYPKSIYVIDWLLCMIFLAGIRFVRQLHEKVMSSENRYKKKVLIIGAGDTANIVIRNLSQSPNSTVRVAGLIDDNPRKKGVQIHGIPVLGSINDLGVIVEDEEPDEFLIAIPSLTPKKLGYIVGRLKGYDIPIKRVPSIWNMVVADASLDDFKTIEPEDVLFRKPMTCDNDDSLREFLSGRRVLVTGAGGSIGSELSTQISSYGPSKLILFEKHEESLYNIDKHLTRTLNGKACEIIPVIGDVTHRERVEEVFARFKPEFVFHAAAYKHVPLLESNPCEALKVNVMGTRVVAEAAEGHGAEKFVLISTDKAVNPTSVMGKTKKIAEKMVLDMSRNSATKYVTVRFGNVLGSSGSVLPLFTEQIKSGGPVTVTDPEITRFFMTIPEAVRLVLSASVFGGGGDVFVLDMGKPIKIMEMAKRMIALNGYTPGVDIEIKIVGLRPGEKLYEELFNRSEVVSATPHPKIRKAVSRNRPAGVLKILDDVEETPGSNAAVVDAVLEMCESPAEGLSDEGLYDNPRIPAQNYAAMEPGASGGGYSE